MSRCEVPRLGISILGSWVEVSGLQNPHSFLSANLFLTRDSGVRDMSHKALLTVPDALYTAINTSYGDDGDKDDNEDYAGPRINIEEAGRTETDMAPSLTDLIAWCQGHTINIQITP